MELKKRYTALNAAQRLAVDTIDGPVMVIAGPGTGKTELLSVRVANILQKTDTAPSNILCLTFTESGAAAMRERLTTIIGKDAYKVAIHTFHSFGTESINQNREYFYNGALFEPADDIARYEILRSIFKELTYSHPLASTMNGEYTYQTDAGQVITELKRSGLTSAELRTILEQNEVTLDRAERLLLPHLTKIDKTTAPALAKLMPDIKALTETSEALYEVTSLSHIIVDSLSAALDATVDHPTKPLTAWKKQWLTKNRLGELTFKSRSSLEKLRALTGVYDEYLHRMEQAGLYDYDDMILQLVHAMEVHTDLKYNLQEKYLYILVDEFQDTNLAQMRILHNLTDNPVNEGRPNLMVVGDDDQAIYSFQGADISNILRFEELYPAAALIALTDNYRSRSGILDEARRVIVQGEDRLENRIERLDKQLTAHQPGDAIVTVTKAETIASEWSWLTTQISAQLEQGRAPDDIAVLTRHHREINELLPFFVAADIPITYERQDNALDEPPIKAIEQLALIVVNLASGNHDVANSLLPNLLAHPAFDIAPEALWRLSSDAYDARQRWLDVMVTTPDFVALHAWLVDLAQRSLTEPLEVMLDAMIGRLDDTHDAHPSPFYAYYFSAEQLSEHPHRYLDYLTALQQVRQQLREYRRDAPVTLASFVEFITVHRRLGIQVPLTRRVGDDQAGAVHLMTAHKSKGLEFPIVYVPNVIDSVWGEKARSRGRLIRYPENLPLAPAGENSDERLRLFYVAMTRAKHELHLSWSALNDRGRSTVPASFIATLPFADASPITELTEVQQHLSTAWYAPYVQPTETLKELLAPRLAHYKLSATHLNAFLDITNGGPQQFLLNNLLHFPSAKSPASSFGSAIHATLQLAHLHLSRTKERKPLEDILHDFEKQLEKERLSDADRAHYMQKGSDSLTAFFTERYDTFTPDQKPELDFKHQDAYLDDVHLTGMLDVATIASADKTMAIVDYKTGKAVVGTPRTEYEKIKVHKYRQQLLFYKLLVEHSRDYAGYTVDDGRLTFVEPDSDGRIHDLPISYDKDELEQFRRLVSAVWQRITTLDLPSIDQYEPTLKGIQSFEQDLIDGAI